MWKASGLTVSNRHKYRWNMAVEKKWILCSTNAWAQLMLQGKCIRNVRRDGNIAGQAQHIALMLLLAAIRSNPRLTISKCFALSRCKSKAMQFALPTMWEQLCSIVLAYDRPPNWMRLNWVTLLSCVWPVHCNDCNNHGFLAFLCSFCLVISVRLK